MNKSTEGVIFSSQQTGGVDILPKHIADQLGKQSESVDSLQSLARLQFIKDVKKAIGSVDDPNLPLSIKPALTKLLSECDRYLALGNESSFVQLCERTIQVCGQGWNYLSYWVSTEQSLCYSIFWGLKAALEHHQKYTTVVSESKNDGLPKNDSRLSDKENNNIAHFLQQKRQRMASAFGRRAPSRFLDFLNRKAKIIQVNLQDNLASNNVSSLNRYLSVRQKALAKKNN